jgi:PAS domain S-box-containing protein
VRELEYLARANFLPGLHLAILRDITGRKHAEEELRKLASIVENSPDFIGIASPEGRVLFVNPAGQSLVGLEGDEQVWATHILDYVADEEKERARNHTLPAVFRHGQREGEMLLGHFKTGATIPMLERVFFIT